MPVSQREWRRAEARVPSGQEGSACGLFFVIANVEFPPVLARMVFRVVNTMSQAGAGRRRINDHSVIRDSEYGRSLPRSPEEVPGEGLSVLTAIHDGALNIELERDVLSH